MFNQLAENSVYSFFSQSRIVVEIADKLASQCPHVVDVFLDRPGRQIRRHQKFEERTEQAHQLLARRQVFFQSHPRAWPVVQIPTVME